ncbi:reverse transcriptase domain-containing protein, partial [Tanacetum coccineum]
MKHEDKTALIKVLKSHKHAIAWKIFDIKGIDPQFCTHKILMKENTKLVVQHQRRVNPKIYEVIKQEVIKLLEAGLIYPISDSPWVSPVHCVPKKGGITVVTGWRVCIDYQKLNDATRKDHFPLPFMDQMLERLARNEKHEERIRHRYSHHRAIPNVNSSKPGVRMAKAKFGGMMEKGIKDMPIAEYIEYEAEMKDSPGGMLDPIFQQNMKIRVTTLFTMIRVRYEPLKADIDYISDDKAEKRVPFIGDDDIQNEEGVILGDLPCQLPPKELNPGSFTLPCTIGRLNLYATVDLRASVNVMPKSICEHLKLANLKETNMLVKMVDMKKKAPLGIVENIMVRINKFIFPSDLVIIDMLGEPSETMILGRPFLATIHAQIDIFNREISLGIREDRVLFDMDGSVFHSRIHVEKQCIRSCDNECIDTLDSVDNMQELEVKHEDTILFMEKVRYGNKTIDDTTQERRYYKWFAQKSGISHKSTMYENPCKYHHEYPCSYFPQKDKGMPKPWGSSSDKGFKEEEKWESGIKKTDYEPPFVDIETFEIKRHVLWKPSRDFTRPIGPPSGLKGLLHTLNATVIPTKGHEFSQDMFVNAIINQIIEQCSGESLVLI